MSKGKTPKKINMLRLTKYAAMFSGGAYVLQTTGCAADGLLGANLINTLLQFVLSIFLGGVGI